MEAILATVFVSLIALIGIVTLSVNHKLLRRISFVLIALAAGTFLGDAFFHLIPEALEMAVENEMELQPLLNFVLLGVIGFFVLEKLVHWHHHYTTKTEERQHVHPVAVANLVGDGLHNFLDGVAIAAAFGISMPVGLITTLAIVLHEIPQEIADFGILIHSGLSRAKALAFNFFSGLLSVLGAALYLTAAESVEGIEQYLVMFVSGAFIYIAAADLFPEIHKHKNHWQSLVQVVALFAGLAIMFAFTLFEH